MFYEANFLSTSERLNSNLSFFPPFWKNWVTRVWAKGKKRFKKNTSVCTLKLLFQLAAPSEGEIYWGVRGPCVLVRSVPCWLSISSLRYDSLLGGVLSHNCRKRGRTPAIHFFISAIIKVAIHLESTGVCICGCTWRRVICALAFFLFFSSWVDMCTFVCVCVWDILSISPPPPTVHLSCGARSPGTAVNFSESKRLS